MTTHQLLTSHSDRTASSSVKLLTFPMGKLHLALPVDKVKKVQKYVPLHGSGTSHVNLTHIGDFEVTVVDLHQKLFGVSHDELCQDGGYFIITRPIVPDEDYPVQECLGIRVAQSPSLIDVPLEFIRLLPHSYRNADTLRIASHVAAIESLEVNSQTIFILDLQNLIY